MKYTQSQQRVLDMANAVIFGYITGMVLVGIAWIIIHP